MVTGSSIKHFEVKEDIHAFFKKLCSLSDLSLLETIDHILRTEMERIKYNYKVQSQKEDSIKFDPKREVTTGIGSPGSDSHMDQKMMIPGKVKITNEKSEVPGKITISPDKKKIPGINVAKKTPEKIDIKSLQKKLQDSPKKKEEEDWQKTLISKLFNIGLNANNNKPKGRYDK